MLDLAQWNSAVLISVPVLALLLMGNLVFGKQLLNKLNKLDETVTGSFPVYNEKLSQIAATSLKQAEDIKEMGALRERVAVLEYAMKTGGLKG